MQEQEAPTANVTVTFKRSSTRDRGEGFEVRSTELASPEEVTRAFEAARMARRLCLAELGETALTATADLHLAMEEEPFA